MLKIIPFFLFLSAALPAQAGEIAPDCTYNGIPLYGDVKIVEHFGDFEVRKVDFFADLDVKYSTFAHSCGEWKLVDIGEDFSVEFVDIGEDFSIREVTDFPGMN